MSLERTVKWIDKTEGRDKFCKAIQYTCRFLKHRFEQQGNKQASRKFEALFTNMRDARKLFRLLKSVNEAKKIKQLWEQNRDMENVLNMVVRLFFFMYWLFDNLNILSKIKILSGDPKKYGKMGSTFWFLALLTNLILLLKNLASNFEKTQELQRGYFSASQELEMKEKKKNYQSSINKRNLIYLNILKVLGDVIPAGKGAEIFNASESACGIGGLIAALITSYQLYD